MLVKHNISPSYKLNKDNLVVWDNGVELRFEEDIIVINRLKSNGMAYQSIRNDIEIETPVIVKFILENINGTSVYVGTNGLKNNTGGITSNTIEKREVQIAGLRSDYSLQLQIRVNSDEECRLKIYGITISTGEEASDVYLPNINTLTEDKQLLLPPEGNYKEITPL